MHYLHRLFWLSAVFNFYITAKYIEGAKNSIADAIPCLLNIALLICIVHWVFFADTVSLGLFYKHVYYITCLSVMHCFFPLGSLASSLEQELNSKVFNFRSHTFADTMKHSYHTY